MYYVKNDKISRLACNLSFSLKIVLYGQILTG